MRVRSAVIRWILWAIALLGCPAAYLAAALHPAWSLDVAAAAVPVVSGSVAMLLVTETRWLRIRPVHARPGPAITLQHLLWTGVPAAIFMIAIAQSDPVTLRVLDYCGTALLVICAGGLPLRWWFTRRARQPVERVFYELRQRQAWNDQELGAIRRAVREAFRHADRDDPVEVDENGNRLRHLRPVRPQVSDDTGPQRAILG